MADSPLVQTLRAQLARYPNLDPQAVLAISQHEGLSGGIGDGGHAFGPFQLNNAGGAYPSWAPQGSPTAANAWAWSPDGLNYALKQIAGVAGGLHGHQAIVNIASRFERPANIPAEIADADHWYGLPPQGGTQPAGYAAQPTQPVTPLRAAAGAGTTGNAPQLPGKPAGPAPIAAPIRLALQLLGAGGGGLR